MSSSVARAGARRTAFVGVLVAVLFACGGDDTASQPRETNLPSMGVVLGTQRATYEYLIPEGAGDRLAAGEAIEIIPGTLEATVGQSIKIVNEDRRGHSIGPWYVGPNETLLQKFTSPGTFEGLCSVHPSGALVLEVTES